MTTYVGKDVVIKLGGTQVTKVQEFSFEIDNGQIETRQVGSSTIQEFAWTKQAVSGSMTIRPDSSGTYSISALFAFVLPSNDLPTAQPTDDITLEFGVTPDFTLTLTSVAWATLSSTIGLEEATEFEIPYVALASTIA